MTTQFTQRNTKCLY